VATIALGQSNKVASVDLTNLGGAHPYYPQTVMGAGVNDVTGQSTAFQWCSLNDQAVIVGDNPPTYCGKQGGKSGDAPGQFGYPIDTAFGNGALYVAEADENEVSVIGIDQQGCPCPLINIGSGPGDAAGQLNGPSSIVFLPGNSHLLIANGGSRRIDEFTTGGRYIRSFGFGVLKGTSGNKFEECGVDIGKCQAGTPYTTEPRSYFSQLDLVNGQLYAATPLDNSIQVIDIGASGSADRAKLSAKPRIVKKGARTTLTATLLPCPKSATNMALFQKKVDRSWDNLGRAKAVDDNCQAKKREKITKKSVFRVVSIAPDTSTAATSPTVTVKLK
jgi:DNA-binding beta-propeller fold protein YncE